MTSGIVTLTTDFGISDPYVGVMKGVILGRFPGATIVDITHHVPFGDRAHASLALRAAFPYFPPRTTHLVVVDPGVGSSRRILAAEAMGQIFLAPDTGIVPAALDPFGRARPLKARFHSVDSSRHSLPRVSGTFHGRDIFAPAGAALASGSPLEEMGPSLERPQVLTLPGSFTSESSVKGIVLLVDSFGNLVTNIQKEDLPANPWHLRFGPYAISHGATFSSVASGDPVAYVGSSGLVEVAVRDGDASSSLGASKGDTVSIEVFP
jgi:S-adenosylmethionine hydrolase